MPDDALGIETEEPLELDKANNLAEHMPFEQFTTIRNPEEGYVVGPRGLLLDTLHEDGHHDTIVITGRTGEYFWDGEVNVEWYQYKGIHFVDTNFNEIGGLDPFNMEGYSNGSN